MSEPLTPAVLQGPWDCAFALRAPLTLRSKSNFRRHRGNVSAAASWGDAQEFERSLALLVRAARPSQWVVGDAAVPLAERPVVVAFISARSTIDVANFSKSVLDACQGVLYVSDASVLGESSVGERGKGGSVLLGFAQLPPGTGPLAVHDALSRLGSLTLAAFL